MILAIRDCGAWGGGRRAGRSLTPQNAGNRIYGTRVFISTFPGGEYPLTPPPPQKKKLLPRTPASPPHYKFCFAVPGYIAPAPHFT